MSLTLPKFPARVARSRESQAIDRDQRDLERLAHIEHAIVTTAVMLSPEAFDLEHPYRRFSPLDLLADLAACWGDIQRERENYKGALVIEDEDAPP